MAAFGAPITFTPAVSQPDAAAYPAQGVFAQKPVQIPLDDGTYHSTVQPALGIRLGDFAATPEQGDSFVLNGTTWFVGDIVPDGQGGADLMLRKTNPLLEVAP